MSNSELLACPRCGNSAFIGLDRAVWCLTDRCLRLPPRATRAESVEAWNTRTQLDELRAENARLKEVLTPSADTKASYIGEFKFSVEMRHPRLGSEFRSVDVPWTTIKEIMAAIRSKALGGTNV